MSAVSPEEATVLDHLQGRGYSLVGKIGHGAYSTVYAARYSPEGCDRPIVLACKVIDTKKVPKHFVKKFLPRELDVMKSIHHHHIISVHSIFSQGSNYFIFMNYAAKGDLLTFILKKGAIKEEQAYIWFRQLTDAVDYLHNRQFAHRDLKCENLLLNMRYEIKLTDFGFARSVVDDQGRSLTSSTFCGSVSYAAPELLSGIPYDPKMADMWSMGVVLYVMLNKAMPFDERNIRAIRERQILNDWKFRAKVIDHLSDDVKYVVTKLLQPKVDDRWTSQDVLKSCWFTRNQNVTQAYIHNASEEEGTQPAFDEITIEESTNSPPTWSSIVLDHPEHNRINFNN